MYNIQYWLDHAGSLFHQIFMIVEAGLGGMAYVSGISYNAINIFFYYGLIPATWIWLISRKTTLWLNAISFSLFIVFLFLTSIPGRMDHLFDLNVQLLNYMAKIFHSNYIDISVYICVIAVALVYVLLIPLTLPAKITKIIFITAGGIFLLYMLIIFPNFKHLMEMAKNIQAGLSGITYFP